MTLFPSTTIQNEYYLIGDCPGTLQYAKDPNEIINLDTNDPVYKNGSFVLAEHSLENYSRTIPDTITGREVIKNSRILLIMKREDADGTIWMKGAFQNKTTGMISLLTSTNNETQLHRALKTQDPNWFVGHFRMSAPIEFWRELRNRLLY